MFDNELGSEQEARAGQYRLFESQATNLVSGDTNGVTDLLIRNTNTGTTNRCSVATNGTQANARAVGGALARSGQWSIWQSADTNLDPADTNGLADIFIHGPGC